MNSNKSLFIRNEETNIKTPSNDFRWCIHISRGGGSRAGVGRGSRQNEKNVFSAELRFSIVFCWQPNISYSQRCFFTSCVPSACARSWDVWKLQLHEPTTAIRRPTTTTTDILLSFSIFAFCSFRIEYTLCGAIAYALFSAYFDCFAQQLAGYSYKISISLDADSRFIDVTRSMASLSYVLMVELSARRMDSIDHRNAHSFHLFSFSRLFRVLRKSAGWYQLQILRPHSAARFPPMWYRLLTQFVGQPTSKNMGREPQRMWYMYWKLTRVQKTTIDWNFGRPAATISFLMDTLRIRSMRANQDDVQATKQVRINVWQTVTVLILMVATALIVFI